MTTRKAYALWNSYASETDVGFQTCRAALWQTPAGTYPANRSNEHANPSNYIFD